MQIKAVVAKGFQVNFWRPMKQYFLQSGNPSCCPPNSFDATLTAFYSYTKYKIK